MKPQNEKPKNNYLDSRTSEERKNEPKSVTTYASKETKNKDWGIRLDIFLKSWTVCWQEVAELKELISDFLAEARAEEKKKYLIEFGKWCQEQCEGGKIRTDEQERILKLKPHWREHEAAECFCYTEALKTWEKRIKK